MTSTTTQTPAERRYTGYQLDHIQVCEANADSFTDRELDKIDEYEVQTEGIPDTLDATTARVLPEGWAVLAVIGHYRAMLELLEKWRDAIDSLRGELTLSGEPLSRAAVMFVSWELMNWQASREAHLSALASHLIGENRHGYWPLPILECTRVRHREGTFYAEMTLLAHTL